MDNSVVAKRAQWQRIISFYKTRNKNILSKEKRYINKYKECLKPVSNDKVLGDRKEVRLQNLKSRSGQKSLNAF